MCLESAAIYVLLLVDWPGFTGWVMDVRPSGELGMLARRVHAEELVTIGKSNPRYKDVWNYSEIYPHILREITHFFSIYKDLEGKRVETRGWRDAFFARSLIVESQRAFEAAEAKAMGKKA